MLWNIHKPDNLEYYYEKENMNPLLAKVLAFKDIHNIEEAMTSRLIFHDFSLFSEGEMAVDRINEAIELKEKICIYGDYDCDGILATVILVEAFHKLGYNVGYHIPNRAEDGYGLNVNRVEQMAEKGYSLIITVDNGIVAYDAIDRANELGIDVIVTDHHMPQGELPEAMAIVHPKISPDYPFKEISGGLVAYKLASALLQKHDKYLFCLAAITTISDMMPLEDENRAIVKRALIYMEQENYPQIALLLGKSSYTAKSLAFLVAPKINSFGRLYDKVNSNILVKYFSPDTPVEYLKKIADNADKLNNYRKSLTVTNYKTALEEVKPEDHFMFAYKSDLHDGLIGLIAGKYTSEYHQPSFVMKYDEVNDVYKGSARGTDYFSLVKAFNELEDEVIQFGGHDRAGGFSVKKDNIHHFKNAIRDYMDENFSDIPDPSIECLKIDLTDISIGNVKSIALLEPYGFGNEEVTFVLEDVMIDNLMPLSDGKHLSFTLPLVNGNLKCLYFRHGDLFSKIRNHPRVSIIGKLAINQFRGIESVNFLIEDLKTV